jgi:hypothetical protein
MKGGKSTGNMRRSDPPSPVPHPPLLWIFIRAWRVNLWFLAGEILKIAMHYETNFWGCVSINTWHGESISTATCLPSSTDTAVRTLTTVRVGSPRNRCSICGRDQKNSTFLLTVQTVSTAHSAFLSMCPGISYAFFFLKQMGDDPNLSPHLVQRF